MNCAARRVIKHRRKCYKQPYERRRLLDHFFVVCLIPLAQSDQHALLLTWCSRGNPIYLPGTFLHHTPTYVSDVTSQSLYKTPQHLSKFTAAPVTSQSVFVRDTAKNAFQIETKTTSVIGIDQLIHLHWLKLKPLTKSLCITLKQHGSKHKEKKRGHKRHPYRKEYHRSISY